MIAAVSGERRQKSGGDVRVLTEWRNKRVVRRELSGLRCTVVVQERRRGVWVDEAKWTVSRGGIDYVTGNVCFRDEWLVEDEERRERCVLVYVDEQDGAVKIERDWRGPPEGYEQLADLEWRVGSRWEVNEVGARQGV